LCALTFQKLGKIRIKKYFFLESCDENRMLLWHFAKNIKLQINFSVTCSQFYVKGWQPAHTNFSKNLVKLEKENLSFRKFTAQIAAILLGKLIQILNTK
jgi:hypothetical protein